MHWSLHHGDLLDVPADVLVCSANVYLNLSGGVGGAFLQRYGPAMQEALYVYLRERGSRYVPRGAVVAMPPCGSAYQAVLHAVAIDGLYESSPEIVADAIREALHQAAASGAKTVALTALATGYGRLTMDDFAQALQRVIALEFPPLERVIVGLRSQADFDDLSQLVPRFQSAANANQGKVAPGGV